MDSKDFMNLDWPDFGSRPRQSCPCRMSATYQESRESHICMKCICAVTQVALANASIIVNQIVHTLLDDTIVGGGAATAMICM